MTVSVNIVGKIKIPKLDFSSTLMDVAKKDIVARVAKNMHSGIDLNEKAYKPLAESTIKAKGHDRPLIDTGQLISSWQIVKQGTNKVLIGIKASRKKIAQYLQVDGIKTKTGKRKFNFFGVSDRMEKDARLRMEEEIKKRIQDARR